MTTIINAEARITGSETLGRMLDKLARKVTDFTKSAKRGTELSAGGKGLDKMAASYGQAAKSAEALGRVKLANLSASAKQAGDLAKNLNQVGKATQQVAAGASPLKGLDVNLKRELSALGLARRDMQALGRDYIRMQREQEKALTGITNPKIRAQILDRDSSGIARRLREQAVARRGERDVMRDFTDHPDRRTRRRIGEVARTGVAVAGIGGGTYVAQRAVRGAVSEGAGNVREDIRAKNAGITAEESLALRNRASEISMTYPSLAPLAVREQGRLLIPNVGDAKTAMELLPEYIKGQVALQTIAGPENAGKEMETFAKFVDLIGRSRDVEATKSLIGGYVSGRQLDSGAFNADDFLNAAKTAGAAGKGLSNPFWSKVFPALAMQQGGARTGTDFASAFQNTVMSRGTKTTMAAQKAAGLRDKNGIVDPQLFTEDPHAWAKKNLVPWLVKQKALPKSYLTGDYSEDLTPEQRTKTMEKTSSLFSNRRGANLFGIMLSDLEQFEMVMKRLSNTRGTADVVADQKKDPYVAGEGIVQQLRNLGSVLLEPGLQKAGPVLGSIADGLARLNNAIETNPKAKEIAGEVAGQAVTKGALPAAGGLTWLLGSLAKVGAGEGTGVVSNLLRAGSGPLQTAGRFAMRASVLPSLLSGLVDALKFTGDTYGYRKASGPGSKSHGKRVRAELDERDAARDASPDRARRDSFMGDIVAARGRAAVDAGNFGTTSAIGAGRQAVHGAIVAKLQSQLDDVNERIREANRGAALGRAGGEVPPPGVPAPGIPLPPSRPAGAEGGTRFDFPTAPVNPALQSGLIDAAKAIVVAAERFDFSKPAQNDGLAAGLAALAGRLSAGELKASVAPDQIQANVKPDQIIAKTEGTLSGTIMFRVEGAQITGMNVAGTGIAKDVNVGTSMAGSIKAGPR